MRLIFSVLMVQNKPKEDQMGKGRWSHKRSARERTTTFDEAPTVGSRTDYEFLDSGHKEKLERFGDVLLIRPMAHAIWKPQRKQELWQSAHGRFIRSTGVGGRWKWRHKGVPPSWLVKFEDQSFVLKTTSFGHLGLFPEQGPQWRWIQETCAAEEDISVLNLFAYTGGSTVAAALAGASVCHVDAARGSVDWARENARRTGLGDHPIRWIVDDVQIFLRRELKRGRRYHGIILDPPSFGRGKKGEAWKIEEHLIPLLELCREVLADKPLFFLLSCHSPGFSPQILNNLVADCVPAQGQFEKGEMLLEGDQVRSLPSGTYARWKIAHD
jgi:23S rRNA (cytosine1962-C5)-methyltransferase